MKLIQLLFLMKNSIFKFEWLQNQLNCKTNFIYSNHFSDKFLLLKIIKLLLAN